VIERMLLVVPEESVLYRDLGIFQAEAGNLKALKGAWNDCFLEEASMFPNGAHSDQIDALSGAFARLTAEAGRWFR